MEEWLGLNQERHGTAWRLARRCPWWLRSLRCCHTGSNSSAPTRPSQASHQTCTCSLTTNTHTRSYSTGMLSRWGQRGPEARIFGLGLMQCWPRSHEGCPRSLVVSHRNHVIYVTFFADRKLLLALQKYSTEVNLWHWHCCDCHTGCDFLVLINFTLEHKRSYVVFLASVSAS